MDLKLRSGKGLVALGENKKMKKNPITGRSIKEPECPLNKKSLSPFELDMLMLYEDSE